MLTTIPPVTSRRTGAQSDSRKRTEYWYPPRRSPAKTRAAFHAARRTAYARVCGRSVRLTLTEGLTLRHNVFVLSGVVDETMLYQTSGEGVRVAGFIHDQNTFYNGGRDVPVGGISDPNREPGFSKEDPLLAGGAGNDYASWMRTARLAKGSPSRGRGVRDASGR